MSSEVPGRPGAAADGDTADTPERPPSPAAVEEGTPTVIAGPEVQATLGDRTVEGSPGPRRGTPVGRFLILERLGSGGMGQVFSAYDPDLDRRVAIKLLRLEKAGGREAEARLRMLREAQAMARLSHPNVVAVYEVGTFDGSVFIAMELVAGQTLNAWTRARTRSWKEIVAVFAAAGEGLAAAHAAGIVHRDFKPDNVLVDARGRPRVLDFGLARAVEAGAEPGIDAVAGTTSGSHLSSDLTAVGMVLGTPKYMAPEQLGGVANARSDQFAFCVSLYKALYGELPFDADGIKDLLAAMEEGKVRPPPAASEVPRWLREVVLRGLAHRPEDRFASMTELLAALGQDPGARRRKVLRLAVPAALVVGAGTALALLAGRGGAAQCQGAVADLAGIWDGPRKAAIQAAFQATRKPYAADSWRAAEQALDRRAASWVAMRGEVCWAGVRGEMSAELLDLRQICLSSRLAELRAATDLMAHADARVVERSHEIADGLARIEDCADVHALTQPLRPPRDEPTRVAVAAARAELARARVLQDAGRYAEALGVVRPVAEQARATGYGPVVAEALLRRGGSEIKASELAAAEETLWQAAEAALGAHHVEIEVGALSALAFVAGERARFEEGLRLGRLALAACAGLGENAELESKARNFIGWVHYSKANYDQALEHFRRAERLQERRFGADDPIVAQSLNNIGVVLYAKGEYPEALEHHRRALAHREKRLGPAHPLVAESLTNIGLVLHATGDHDQALAHQLRVLASREASLGPDSPQLAATFINIGIVYGSKGDHDRALEYASRALTLLERALGPDHYKVGVALLNGCDALMRKGEHRKAQQYCERALAIDEKTVGPDHPDVAMITSQIGLAQLSLGRPAEALRWLERARSVCAATSCEPLVPHEVAFRTARALWALGKQREQALALARSAREGFVKIGKGAARERAEVEAFLAAHGAGRPGPPAP